MNELQREVVGVLLDRMAELQATRKPVETAGNARWILDEETSCLFIFGTDDARDWLDNLDQRPCKELRLGALGMKTVTTTQGAAHHAELVLDSMRKHGNGRFDVDYIVGHSLGAAAVAEICLALLQEGGAMPELMVMIGAPRQVCEESNKGTSIWSEGREGLIDITNRCDPVTQLPPWKTRMPWWLAKRVRVGKPWYSVLPQLALAAVVACLGWIGLVAAARLAARPLLKQHHIATYAQLWADYCRECGEGES